MKIEIIKNGTRINTIAHEGFTLKLADNFGIAQRDCGLEIYIKDKTIYIGPAGTVVIHPKGNYAKGEIIIEPPLKEILTEELLSIRRAAMQLDDKNSGFVNVLFRLIKVVEEMNQPGIGHIENNTEEDECDTALQQEVTENFAEHIREEDVKHCSKCSFIAVSPNCICDCGAVDNKDTYDPDLYREVL